MNYRPLHFIDKAIDVTLPPGDAPSKTPPCPQSFIYLEQTHPIADLLAEWRDFTRRGRAARNMRPTHATVAATRGSWGVGRFFFRVRLTDGRIFDLYYDRAPKSASQRASGWFLYAELEPIALGEDIHRDK
jgi:hypothetical protein